MNAAEAVTNCARATFRWVRRAKAAAVAIGVVAAVVAASAPARGDLPPFFDVEDPSGGYLFVEGSSFIPGHQIQYAIYDNDTGGVINGGIWVVTSDDHVDAWVQIPHPSCEGHSLTPFLFDLHDGSQDASGWPVTVNDCSINE